MKKTCAFLMLVMIATNSLSAQKRLEQYEPESLFNEAKTLFENENYSAAAALFSKYLQLAGDEEGNHAVEARFYEAVSAAYTGAGQQQIVDFVRENPTSILSQKANFLYANILLENKKYRDAVKAYESVDAESLEDNDKAEYYFKKGLAYYQTGNVEKASPLFHSSMLMPSAFQDDARYYYAHIQYINKNYDEAGKNFKMLENTTRYKDIVPLYMMQMNFSNGDFSAVTDRADEILAKADGYRKAEIALMLAESWYQQKDYTKALTYYDIARKSTRRSFQREVEFRIGFCKMKAADYEGAVTYFQNATKRKDDKLGQYGSYYLAQCYIETHEEKFARNAFFAAYKADFDHQMSEDALFNYARLSMMPGVDPFGEAVTQLTDFLDKNPHSSRADEARMLVVHLLLNAKDYDKAVKTIERFPRMTAEMEGIYAQLTYNMGIQFLAGMDYDNAVKYLNKTINNAGASAKLRSDAAYWIADAYLQKKDLANAEKSLMAFMKMPGAEQSEMFPLAYYDFGYIFYQKGDFANAIKEFNYFVNQNDVEKTYESDAWMRIGDCLFMNRNYDKAVTAYGNATKLDSKNADYAMFQTGMGYGALGDMNGKVNSMNALCEKYKNSSFYDRALYETGMAHLGANDERAAIAAFDRLVKERPRSSYARQAQVKIGMLYYGNDQYEQALTSLKKVVKDYHNTDESREAVNIIRNIYMETNRTQEFFEYTTANGIATSVSEQDSLAFATAERFYQEGKYEQTLDAVNQYIENNPEGAYLLKINYFGLVSLEKLGRAKESKPYLEYIISQPDNDYSDNALLKIAKMSYDDSDFEKARGYYTRLLEITDNQKIKTEALDKKMYCEFKLEDFAAAVESGRELSNLDLTQQQKNKINYVVGVSLFKQKDYVTAAVKLHDCAHNDRTELGAEAAYYDVLANWNMKDLDKTEEKVFYISDNFGDYTYLIASAFLVLSDVYVAKDNVFQAKETLKSVIENYPDDQHKSEIVEAAQNKLSKLEKVDDENE
ncbi:MAG: tetratricopeptide repeat protein [Bacteroidales bacterium]|nr:tetratricopeptide repeat protein [Bacteroidales bacterium]